MAAAAELARAYDAYISALWRGDADAARFATWLAAYWRAGPAPVPAAPPVAISHCGGGGRGIHWHDTPTAVLGCVPGAGGCYLVPPDAAPPPPGPAHTDVLVSVRHRAGPPAVPPGSPLAHDVCERVMAARPTRETAATDLCG